MTPEDQLIIEAISLQHLRQDAWDHGMVGLALVYGASVLRLLAEVVRLRAGHVVIVVRTTS